VLSVEEIEVIPAASIEQRERELENENRIMREFVDWCAGKGSQRVRDRWAFTLPREAVREVLRDLKRAALAPSDPAEGE